MSANWRLTSQTMRRTVSGPPPAETVVTSSSTISLLTHTVAVGSSPWNSVRMLRTVTRRGLARQTSATTRGVEA
ncbi:MAG: hypothetical protein ACR2NO_12710 [Chloroflexota bacterium]